MSESLDVMRRFYFFGFSVNVVVNTSHVLMVLPSFTSRSVLALLLLIELE